MLDINQCISYAKGIGKGEVKEGEWRRVRGCNATWPPGFVARGQSNLMRPHRGERERGKEMKDGGREGVREQRERRVIGNITSFCVYLLRTIATV